MLSYCGSRPVIQWNCKSPIRDVFARIRQPSFFGFSVFLLFLRISAVSFCLPYHTYAAFPPRNDQRVALREDATLRCVTFADDKYGWAVGDYGSILATLDGGETWTAQESSVTCPLYCVACLDSKRAWAVGGWHETYSGASQAVVLTTDNGGVTWRSIPNSLPCLKWVKLDNPQQATVLGDWSLDFFNSVFITSDAGTNWSPVDRIDCPPLVAATGTEPNWLLDREGCLWQHSIGQKCRRIDSDHSTTLYSDGRLLITSGTNDGEANVSGGPIADPPVRLIDTSQLPLLPQTIAKHDQVLEVAGFPASQTVTLEPGKPPVSSDVGFEGAVHSLQVLPNGKTVAVGSFGAISVRDPEVESWRCVRGQNRETGLLVIASDVSQIPWSLVASESMQHSARVAILVVGKISDTALQDSLRADTQTLLNETIAIAGANEALLLPQSNRINAAIESWHPAAVCFAKDLAPELREQAWQAISNSELLNGIRVVEVADRPSGWYRLDPAAALPTAGEMASDAQFAADWMFRRGPAPPTAVDCRPLLNVSVRQRLEGITARLKPETQKRITKRSPQGTPRQLARLQARTQFPEMIERLHELHGHDVNRFRTQTEQLLAHIGGEDREMLIMGLVQRCALLGDQAAWAETIRVIAKSKIDDAMKHWGVEMQARFETSEEWRRTMPSVSERPLVQTSSASQSPFETDVAFSAAAIDSPIARVAFSQPNKTTISPADVDVASLLNPLSCFRATETDDPRREKQLQQFASSIGSGLWSVRAREELLASDKKHTTIPNEHWTLRTVGSQRPRLDGINDDAVWTTANARDRMQLAYDSQFIYILISTDLPTAAPAMQRSRDAQLDNVARMMIEIDTDRDLCSAYRLEIDASGQTRDSVDGFNAWNPRWFVAVSTTDSNPQIEIAIHRDDLSDLPPLTGDSWRLRVRQIEPSQTQPLGPILDPSGWRMATFD